MSWGFADLITWDIVANQIFWATYNLAEDVFQFSVDPAGAVTVPDASESVKGIIEISDASEALAWTDDLTAMTPKKVNDLYAKKSTFDREFKMHFSFSNSWNDWQWFIFNWFAGVWSSWWPLGSFMESSVTNQYIVHKMNQKPSATWWPQVSLNWDQVEDLEFEFELAGWGEWIVWFADNTWSSYYDINATVPKIQLQYGSPNTSVRLSTRDGTTQENSAEQDVTSTWNIVTSYKIVYSRTAWTCQLWINWVLKATNTVNMPTTWTVWFGIWQSTSTWDMSISEIDIRINYT